MIHLNTFGIAPARFLAALVVGMVVVGCGSSSDGGGGTGETPGAPGQNGVPSDTTTAQAAATISPYGTGQVSGTYTFVESASGVTGSFKVHNCEEGKTYYGFVREGHGCGSEADIGSSWGQDPDGVFDTCTNGEVWGTAVRIAQPSLPSDWSIGTGSKTDIVGHSVIVTLDDELVDDTHNVGCGVIAKAN
jgi:hypothetical protein